MTTTADFATSFQNQFLENIRRSQQAVIDSLGLWAESFERAIPDARSAGGALPSAEQVIDNSFDFAERLLGAQRQFAKSVLGTAASGVKEASDKVEPERPAPARKSTS